jgi:hypothetical protein
LASVALLRGHAPMGHALGRTDIWTAKLNLALLPKRHD